MGGKATGSSAQGDPVCLRLAAPSSDGGPGRRRPLPQRSSQRECAGPSAGGRRPEQNREKNLSHHTPQPHTKANMFYTARHIHAHERFQRNSLIYLGSGGGGAKPYPIARTPADLYQDN